MKYGIVLESFFDKCDDVGVFLIVVFIVYGFIIVIEFVNFLSSFFLDFWVLRQQCNKLGDLSCDCVQVFREYGQVDRGQFVFVEFGFFVQDDVGLYVWLVSFVGDVFIEGVIEICEVFVVLIMYFLGFG